MVNSSVKTSNMDGFCVINSTAILALVINVSCQSHHTLSRLTHPKNNRTSVKGKSSSNRTKKIWLDHELTFAETDDLYPNCHHEFSPSKEKQ